MLKDALRVGRTGLRDFMAALLGPETPAPTSDPTDSSRQLGAGEPLPPELPRGTDARQFQPAISHNLSLRPRAGYTANGSSFEVLRALSGSDLVRTAINDVKGQIRGMRWEIGVKDEYLSKAQQATGEVPPGLQVKVDAARRFCDLPDPLAGLDWFDWSGSVLEEVLVTDALTLLPRHTVGGDFLGMEQVDGATILPLLDDRGRPPLPPTAAYQQIIHGRPETEFTLGELLYLPYNRRPWTPYGLPPVEQVLWTVNLALRRQLFDLHHFTTGTIPDGLWAVADTWTPEMVARFQTLMDEELAGRDDRRAGRLKIMPPGEFHKTKAEAWDYQFMEWLARVIAWAFGISPMPIAKQMNRSTSEVQEMSATESGTRPLADFLARVVNRALVLYLDAPEVEFRWAEDEVEDATIAYQRGLAQVEKGVQTVNEEREANGKPPYPFETPAFLLTPAGPVFLEDVLALREVQLDAQMAGAEAAAAMAESGQLPGQPAPEDSEDEEGEGAPSENGPAEKAWRKAVAGYRLKVAQDLQRWEKVLSSRLKENRAPKAFASKVLLPHVRREVDLWTKAARAQATPDLGVATLRNGFARIREVLALDRTQKAEPPVTGKRLKAEKKLKRVLSAWLAEAEAKLVSWALNQIPAGKLQRSPMPDLGDGELAEPIAEALLAAANAGAATASAAIGVSLGETPQAAASFARTRAGELVGMKWVDGAWHPTAEPRFRISDTLRGIVKDTVIRATEEGWSPQKLASALRAQFDPWRAETIARTETGFAYGNGAAEVYRDAGVEYVEILDGAGCLPFGHQDGAAKGDGTAGVVSAEEEADGQVWSVGQYQSAVLGHPNCVRAAVPYVQEGN